MATQPPRLASPTGKATILLALLWLVVAAAVLAVREVLLPFAVAGLIAYVLHPAVSALNRVPLGKQRLPRWAATLVMYGFILGAAWGLGNVFVPQVRQEMSGISTEVTDAARDADTFLSAWIDDVNDALKSWGVPAEVEWSNDHHEHATETMENGRMVIHLREQLVAAAGRLEKVGVEAAGMLAQRAGGFAGAVLGFIFKFFLVFMLAAFMLSDVGRIRETVLSLVPVDRRAAVDKVIDNMDTGLSGVVRGQLTICAVNATLTLVGLLLFGVKFAFLMALVAGVMSLIPIFGSIASSVPIVAVALSDSFQKALLALAWIVGIHALEANFLNPKIMGSAAKIHPVLVVMVLVAGEHFYGFTGALFAVPALSVCLTVFKAVHAYALRLQTPANTAGATPSPAIAPAVPAVPSTSAAPADPAPGA